MLFTGWEVRVEKYFVEVSKHIYSENILSRSFARGRRPRDVFETETKYFSMSTRKRRKIYFFIFLCAIL
jgi:hypothetical protein